MRSDCIRLLVAAELRLGQPVRTSLPLTDEARDRVIDSTCQAWQQIQTIAVDREIDIVVLNGETFVIDEYGAAAEQALREGLAFLLEAGIRVVLHPGNDEHRGFWREFLSSDADLRVGVSLLAGTIPLPISSPSHDDEEADDEERILCRLVSIDDHILPAGHDPREASHQNETPFTIGLNSFSRSANTLPPGIDVLLTGGSAYWRRSFEDSLAQCLCAAPQALSQDELDAGIEPGCLLIELSESGEVHVERLPAATVRFLECELDLASSRDWDEAALLLQNQVESIAWDDLERVRLITWSLTAADPHSLQLLDGSGVDALISAWSRSFPLEDDLQVIHAFRAADRASHQWINSQNNDTKALAEALFRQGENPRLERLREEWSADEHSSELWNRLNPQLRPAQIGRHAEALMSHWLNISDPENLPYETHLS